MKKLLTIQCFFLLLSSASFSQVIQGDRLLDLLGKPLTDPLVLQFKQQEDFYNDNWNRSFTVYMDRDFRKPEIGKVQLLNGEKKSQSEERYGYYRKQLPLNFNWSMTRAGFEMKIGSPVKTWYETTHDYLYKGFKIRITFEGKKAVMMNFQKDPDYVPLSSTTILRLNANGVAELNWLVLKKFILAGKKMKPFAGKDSAEYNGEVFYSTPYKVEGFDKSAVKRYKTAKLWHYEAYYTTDADSNKVAKIFFSLYDELTKTIKDSTGGNYVFRGGAEDHISKDPMYWIATWENNKVQPGLDKMRISLGMFGTKNSNNAMQYIIKFYVAVPEVPFAYYTWDNPQ